MGVIKEDNHPNLIKKMIDKLGLPTAIKMVGDYDLVMRHITEEDKINFIRNTINELNGGNWVDGLRLSELNISPILYYDGDDTHSYIEYIVPDGVYVDIYSKGHERHLKDYKIPYEKLDDEILNELFKELISIV